MRQSKFSFFFLKFVQSKSFEYLGILFLFFFIGYFYLLPGSAFFLQGDHRYLISNGGDSTPVPFYYHTLIETFINHFSYLFYGTVYTPQLNQPSGMGLWIPWSQRIIGLILAPFFSIETLSTGYLWCLMVLNGFFVYILGRSEKWPIPLSLALGICFSFNSYTRGRSVAHDALVGIYFLPAIFLGLKILKTDHDLKSKIFAAFLFLVGVSSAQYFIMMSIPIAPFFLWYFLSEFKNNQEKKKALIRLILCGIPSVLFVLWNVLAPLPSEIPSSHSILKPPPYTIYLDWFAAKPIDYLAHDIGLGPWDWNPLRKIINQKILSDGLGYSNPHERSNGIRWGILILSSIILFYLFNREKRKNLGKPLKLKLIFFMTFSAAMFYLSLSPLFFSSLDIQTGPSLWLHQLIPNFRVPCRFGPLAQFGMIMMCGYFIHDWFLKRQKKLQKDKIQLRKLSYLMWLLPLWAILDYFPYQPLIMDLIRPARTELIIPGKTVQEKDHCGAGLYFPYMGHGGPLGEEERTYSAVQQMRHTPCLLGNYNFPTSLSLPFVRSFGLDRYAKDQEGSIQNLKKFLECSHYEWVVFREFVDPTTRDRVCQLLNWKRVSADACRNPNPQVSFAADIQGCIP